MGKRPLCCTLGAFTVFEPLKRDVLGTLRRVHELGYESIEYYGEPERDPIQLAGELREAGLALNGWHVEWRHLQPETLEQTIRYCKDVGLKRVIIPCLGSRWEVGHTLAQECKAVWEEYLPRIAKVYERLAQEGIELGYHNHEHEFQLQYDGQSVFELLYSNLPQGVIMELDSGNTIEGGADPAEVIRRYGDRKIILHCKPYSKKKGFDVMLGDADDDNDWAGMIRAFGEKNPELIIECESRIHEPFCAARDALAALQKIWKSCEDPD